MANKEKANTIDNSNILGLKLTASNSAVSQAINQFEKYGMKGYGAVKSVLSLMAPIEQPKRTEVFHSASDTKAKNLFDQLSWVYDQNSKPNAKQKEEVLKLTEKALNFIADGGPHIRRIHGQSYNLPKQQREKVKDVANKYSIKLKEIKEQGSGLANALILLSSAIGATSFGFNLLTKNVEPPVSQNVIKSAEVFKTPTPSKTDVVRATPNYIYDATGNLIDITYEKSIGYTFGEINQAWMTIATTSCGPGTARACWGGKHVGIVKDYKTEVVAGFYEAPNGLYYLIDVDAIKKHKD